ncbi:MAG: hypothetical protein J0H49_00800 [Acidobacteria bacterium]|nr:hypothetical protein [Acidobacteriota bacterium]
MVRRAVQLLVCSAMLGASLWAEVNGAPAFTTNAPGDGICTDCHGGSINSGAGKLTVSMVDASAWTPGQQVRLQVTLADPQARRWGFNITARLASDPNAPAGTLAVSDTANTKLNNGGGGIQFVTHTSAGTRLGTTGSSTWEFLWTPPDNASAGAVTFYAAGNAANGNNQPDTGDKIYTTTLAVSPASTSPDTTVPPPAPTINRIVPRFVFGENWSARLYLYNTTDSAAKAFVFFTGNDGTPMSGVPGGAAPVVDLAPHGSTVIAAPAGGAVTEGYAALSLPDGVSGYVVLTKSPPDQPAIETVLNFTAPGVKSSTLAWDDTTLTTQLSLSNPGSENTTVRLTLADPGGQAVASTSIALPAKTKLEVNLKDIPEFTATTGNRGTVLLTVDSGSFSVAGFRVGTTSFSAIPSTDK